ncbi:MAG: SDR family oxidoreductase [Pseudomonadota bacterium]
MKETILVTGATGTVGREVVKSLLQKDVKIRVGIRDTNKIKKFFWSDRVESVLLDYARPQTLANALVNVDRLFLITPQGSDLEQAVAKMVIEQGGKQGLRHITRLSSMGATQTGFFRNHYEADQLLLAANIPYTALQANTFMQNFYNFVTSISKRQKIVEPAGEGKTSFIDVRDIADVAATVLTQANHVDKCYELTGAESLDYYQVAAIFSKVLRRKVVYQALADQAYIATKETDGISADVAKRSMQFFQGVKNGEYARVSPVVEKILARTPISLEKFIVDYRNRFDFESKS